MNYHKAKHNANEIESTTLRVAEDEYIATYQKYYQSKGWFFSCDSYCQHNYEQYLIASQEFKHAKAEYEDAVKDAKQIVGIWSTYGVDETRNEFWKCWEWGKAFAKRMSMYDALFVALDSRNESFATFIIQLIFRVLANFTLGFISATIQFIWNLWFLIRQYGGGWSGVIYFILAAIASCSLLISMIIAMYSTVAVGAGIAIAYSSDRAIRGGRYRRTQHLHYQ